MTLIFKYLQLTTAHFFLNRTSSRTKIQQPLGTDFRNLPPSSVCKLSALYTVTNQTYEICRMECILCHVHRSFCLFRQPRDLEENWGKKRKSWAVSTTISKEMEWWSTAWGEVECCYKLSSHHNCLCRPPISERSVFKYCLTYVSGNTSAYCMHTGLNGFVSAYAQ